MKFYRTIAWILVLVTVLSMAPAATVEAKTTKEKLKEAQEEHEKTKEKLNDTKDNIAELGEAKSELKEQLNRLNEKLKEVSERLESLEKQIESKEKEIQDTSEDLKQARVREASQYEAMKKRIQFMYESQENLYVAMLFSSSDYADLINLEDYIQQLSDYDKKMLQRYESTRKGIEVIESNLKEQKEQLDVYKEEIVEEQAKVAGYVEETNKNIAAYTNQISDAEAQAKAYEEQAEKEAADIAALQKKLQEEIALSKLAVNSSWRNISEVVFEEGDRYLLANIIYCEAGNQPYEGQLAVGAVVVNRVLSSVFPNTVVGVVYQSGQFSPVASGRLAIALAQNKATQDCYRAADEAMAGHTNVGSCVHFRTPIEGLSGIQIGGHIFY